MFSSVYLKINNLTRFSSLYPLANILLINSLYFIVLFFCSLTKNLNILNNFDNLSLL